MPLKISGVEDMYRWVNLRDAAGGSESRATNINEPANFPDNISNGKDFIFVHGYSVSEKAARGWNAEMFKRLYQSGSNAMYTAVTWYGNQGQIPLTGGITPDYYQNVRNAFATAAGLKVAVVNLPGANGKYIAGHSLGNMLVSSAIADSGLSVNAYFMLNAAVAQEAYDATVSQRDSMRHPDWAQYDTRLWASEWYQLFPSGDARSKLTWRNRFGNIANAYNYYSASEDVLTNGNGAIPSLSESAWYNQEIRKGTFLMWLAPGNCEGGWGANNDYLLWTRDSINALADNTDEHNAILRTDPYFNPFDNNGLFGNNGSAVADNPVVRAKILADAIPALSFAMGANGLQKWNDESRNRNMELFKTENMAWPDERGRWKHSDIKNVAFPFNYRLFEDIIITGGLK